MTTEARPTHTAAFCATCFFPSDANQEIRNSGASNDIEKSVVVQTAGSTHSSINAPSAASLSAYESKHSSATNHLALE